MKTIKQIVSHIARQEGKKHQASVGDVREILSILSDLFVKKPQSIVTLCDNGRNRAKRRK